MLSRHAETLERCQPYLVISDLFRSHVVSTAPLGVTIPAANIFNPRDVASAEFLHLVQRLNDLIYIPVGMQMPRWAFYDCAQVAGGIFGMAARGRTVSPAVLAALGLAEGYAGLVPLSIFTAIPMLPDGAFLNFTLCSINEHLADAAPSGLRLLTKALGVKVLPIRTLYATAQWRSPTLGIHTRFGALALVTAYTPAHSLPATVTVRFDVTDERIARALSGEATPARPDAQWLDADDVAAMGRVQAEIEAGAEYSIVADPVQRGSSLSIPLWRA